MCVAHTSPSSSVLGIWIAARGQGGRVDITKCQYYDEM